MGIIHTLVRWYTLNHGIGKEMRAEGAEVLPCPHCETDTPVYPSAYDAIGNPISFSVCLWCTGVVEYSETTGRPHVPYASIRDLQTELRQSNSE